MVEVGLLLSSLCFIFLCFVGIPIKVDMPKSLQNKAFFEEFLLKYNKTYPLESAEYNKHFRTFEESLAIIEELNSKKEATDSAVYGLTQFSDLSQEEFKKKHLWHHYHKIVHKNYHQHTPRDHNHVVRRAVEGLPDKVDWRTKGVVTAVKNQKMCGACWAFSTVETIESMFAIQKGVLKTFSVQEIIDCAQNGNMGCNGGDTCTLLEWLVDNSIIVELDKDYPLVLKNDVCKLKKNVVGVQVAANYSCDYFVDEQSVLLTKLAFHGPVAVAVNALPWQFYLGGVIQFHCDGEIDDINHAVQIVGYDLSAPTPHYIARNSWGPLFGEKGYVKIAIGGNVCGIATEVASLNVL